VPIQIISIYWRKLRYSFSLYLIFQVKEEEESQDKPGILKNAKEEVSIETYKEELRMCELRYKIITDERKEILKVRKKSYIPQRA